MEFAACMADAERWKRETAGQGGGKPLYTAWFMRMRVCEVMGRRLPARGSPSRWTARTSRSRCWATTPAAGSAWEARPRTGHDASRAGLGGSVCVLCGVSETGDCFCELADGAEDGHGVALAALGGGWGRRPAWWPPTAAPYAGLLGGRPHEVRPSRELEMVNSPALQAQGSSGAFNGVSNRRPALPRLVCWREQFRRSARGRRELLFAHEASGNLRTRAS